jgi:hypothetical protein
VEFTSVPALSQELRQIALLYVLTEYGETFLASVFPDVLEKYIDAGPLELQAALQPRGFRGNRQKFAGQIGAAFLASHSHCFSSAILSVSLS